MLTSPSFAVASRALGALPLALGLTLAGCARPPAPPQEEWMVVTSDAAPLLGELEDDEGTQDVARKGELVRIVHEIRPFHWAAKMDGAPATRDGMALEVERTVNGSVMFAFKPDFGAQVSIPSTSYLCEAIGAKSGFDVSRCPTLLRRARTPEGTLLLYLPCTVGPCPVGVLRDGKLETIAIENLMSARFHGGDKKSLLLATTRWTKDEGKRSGGALVPVTVEGGTLEAGPEIATDMIDARDPQKVTARIVQVEVTAAEVILRGEETVKGEGGATLSTRAIDEKHALPK